MPVLRSVQATRATAHDNGTRKRDSYVGSCGYAHLPDSPRPYPLLQRVNQQLRAPQGAYTEALAAYTRALQAHPGAPAEVRLGLAACYFRLGRLAAARAAFQRTLALAPGCAEALLGLAVIAFAGPDAERRAAQRTLVSKKPSNRPRSD